MGVLLISNWGPVGLSSFLAWSVVREGKRGMNSDFRIREGEPHKSADEQEGIPKRMCYRALH